MNQILEGIGFEPVVEWVPLTTDNIDRINQTAEVMGPDGEIKTITLTEEIINSGEYKIPKIGKGKFKGPPKKALNPGNKKPPAKSGGGKKGGGSKEKWENPYDKQYNTIQKINEELRKREKLERRYQNLIAKSGTNAVELQKNSEKEIESIRKEMKLREELLQKRKDEMKKYENKNKKYEKYAYYDEEQGRVVINWDEINKVKDPKKGEAIKEYIEGLENLEE
jgi:hypothetical protein